MAIQEMLLSLTEYLTSLSFISYNDTIKNERRLAVKLPCGSASINNTFFPCLANPTPRFKVVVLFATPPFWFATAMTFATPFPPSFCILRRFCPSGFYYSTRKHYKKGGKRKKCPVKCSTWNILQGFLYFQYFIPRPRTLWLAPAAELLAAAQGGRRCLRGCAQCTLGTRHAYHSG